ncbi:glycosyltransferase family 2 protein [Epilithonimonas sp. JDS]|uniref:glycosyltransferase family 2 protein n=1 Tax=Epilithonimonas sp. JDS TaxID=2902797 RepID=UPI001E5CC0DD|nr:glycosyltransferase family A protein [Epilithonimonas sp. JDS]MCD9853820.1 glycosyltransferase family 2 protein [Epilithonimonas sp. JDS]
MLISVIIPSYNSTDTIERAIDSVIHQTYQNWELILVDNNSTDNTSEKLYEYQKKFPDRITVLKEVTKGAPAARNKGLYEAKGEWIQFLDADDELLPEKIEYQVSQINDEISLIVSPAKIFRPKNHEFVKEVYHEDLWIALILSMLGITSANLWRRSSLLEINGWDNSKTSSQEYDLLFRIMKNQNKIKYLGEIHTNIYQIGVSVSRDTDKHKHKKIILSRVRLRVEIKKYLQENNLLTSVRSQRIDSYIIAELRKIRKSFPLQSLYLLNSLPLEMSFVERMKKNINFVKS